MSYFDSSFMKQLKRILLLDSRSFGKYHNQVSLRPKVTRNIAKWVHSVYIYVCVCERVYVYIFVRAMIQIYTLTGLFSTRQICTLSKYIMCTHARTDRISKGMTVNSNSWTPCKRERKTQGEDTRETR